MAVPVTTMVSAALGSSLSAGSGSQHRQARQQAVESGNSGPFHCITAFWDYFLRNHISVSNINELYFGFLLWVPNAVVCPTLRRIKRHNATTGAMNESIQ